MQRDVALDLQKSSRIFRDTVWPVIGERLGGGDLIPVESVTAEGFQKLLDVEAGIDGWQVVRGSGMRGIASRVQTIRDNHVWRSFTVRYWRENGRNQTEWHKRIKALATEENWLSPHWTVQAYVDKQENLLYACATKTSYLYFVLQSAENRELYRVKEKMNKGSYPGDRMAAFYAVWVDSLIEDGCPVEVWDYAPQPTYTNGFVAP